MHTHTHTHTSYSSAETLNTHLKVSSLFRRNSNSKRRQNNRTKRSGSETLAAGPLVATQIAAAQKAEAEAENETGAWGSSQDESLGSKPGRGAAAETVAGAMTLAVVLGVTALGALELGSDAIIGWAGGHATAAATTTTVKVSTVTASTSMSSEAEAYLRVRALSAPAALVGTVAVGAYRGLLVGGFDEGVSTWSLRLIGSLPSSPHPIVSIKPPNLCVNCSLPCPLQTPTYLTQ